MESLFGNVDTIVQNNPWLGLVVVYIGGLLTATNPCVIAMIPLTIGFVGGYCESGHHHWKGRVRYALLLSVALTLGLSVTFTILGIIAGTIGSLFGDVGNFWRYLVSAVCLIMGLHLLGLLRFNIPTPKHTIIPKHKGLVGAFILGLLFGIVSTPCAAPILIVLLAYITAKGSIVYGALLLLFYAFGHCTLVLVAGTSIGAAKSMLDSKGLMKASNYIKKTAGVIIFLLGGYILFVGK